MNVEIRDQRFRTVVGDDVEIEEVGSGFEFTEGPIWNHVEKHLTFSDIPGNTVRRWRPMAASRSGASPATWPMGMPTTLPAASSAANTPPVASPAPRATAQSLSLRPTTALRNSTAPTTSSSRVTARSTLPIQALAAGSITAGRARSNSTSRAFTGSIPRAANSRYWSTIFDQPNGLCFSLDESRLFVNDTMRAHVRVFDVNESGTLENGRVWAEVTGDRDGVPDGMKIDSAGNLYVTGPGGIHIFAPDATCLGVIYTPQGCANFCWGEDDMKSLFVTAGTSLYRLRVKVAGNRSF